ncbi:MAG TPA: LysM peptidoglycan-binding domain-containing protein [Opitutaceae bacterium]|nr:LysM peptidoglycan-binding domain-containing protein [Opitutaceae bacterium]
MKILKILGAVLAVHLLAFVFIFTSPGCQSGPRNVPTPDSTVVAGPGGTLAAPPPEPMVVYPSAGASGRSAPTRPGSPNAAAVAPVRPAPASVTPVSTYTVERGDSLWSIAKRNKLTVAELARANGLGVSAALRPGQKLIIPGQPTAPSDLATAPSGPTYTVLPGDTFATIARKHGIATAELLAANNRTSDIVRTGERLVLPPNAKPPTSVPEPSIAPATGGQTHTVAPGESLGVIARRYGVRVADLAAANNITDPSRVRAGQQLVIPGRGAPAAVARPPAASGTAPATPTATPPASTPAAPTAPPPSFDLTPPPPGQDLDAGLKDDDADVPTVKVEDPPKE